MAYFQELTQPLGNGLALDLGEVLEKCYYYQETSFELILVDS